MSTNEIDVAGIRARAEAAESEVERLIGLMDRNGIRYCLCSRADRTRDRPRPECPHHGMPQHHHVNVARAERDELSAQLADRDRVIAAVRECVDTHWTALPENRSEAAHGAAEALHNILAALDTPAPTKGRVFPTALPPRIEFRNEEQG